MACLVLFNTQPFQLLSAAELLFPAEGKEPKEYFQKAELSKYFIPVNVMARMMCGVGPGEGRMCHGTGRVSPGGPRQQRANLASLILSLLARTDPRHPLCPLNGP